ncbi:unnamed protein product [Lepeophtheirus salmonis]|uniref:(salmon louse) hypothetical protein n=1 Tax=Lepeophtheirus salmonis TaxID=72036 RepID=A0A7R8H0A5_LEPSM|nr:unnamed protein product [Lepeophtheirus salmonis]CAF2780672.1 unnamed protein product [Lepeophtheirus salmonis]
MRFTSVRASQRTNLDLILQVLKIIIQFTCSTLNNISSIIVLPMSVKVLPTCEATRNPSRTRQGLKLSFNRSISDPQSGVGTSSSGGVLHHPHKRFCPPPYPIPEEETPLDRLK